MKYSVFKTMPIFLVLLSTGLLAQDAEESDGFSKRFYIDFSLGFGNLYATNFEGNSIPTNQTRPTGDYSGISGFTQGGIGFGYELGKGSVLLGKLKSQRIDLTFRADDQLALYRGGRGNASLIYKTYLNNDEGVALKAFSSVGAYYSFGSSELQILVQGEDDVNTPFQTFGMLVNFGIRHESGIKLYFEGAGDLTGNHLRLAGYSINAGYDIYIFDLF